MNSKRSIKSKIIAHLDGDLSVNEVKELSDWIAKSKENTRYFTEVKDLWEASLTNASEMADTVHEWNRFLNKISHKKRTEHVSIFKSLWIKQLAAAVIILGLVISSIIILNTKKESVYFSAIAPKGSISQFILPDSTLIYLNAGSEIRCNVSNNQPTRQVFLKGEAYFNVTKQKRKPFIVHTAGYDIQVLGTQFNVKAYPEDNSLETTLEEGTVLITSSKNLTLSENVTLKPGEQLRYEKDKKVIQLEEVDTKIYTSWKDNKLIFLNMNLKDLFALMERKYGVNIEVENKDILKYHYSGTIKNETVLEMLDIIKHTLPVEYKIEEQIIKIYQN